MSATVVPFPSVRRVDLIRRQGRYLASQTPDAAEKRLATGLKRQRDSMRRRGIAPDIIEADVRALELAIRAEIWRRVLLTPGGAA